MRLGQDKALAKIGKRSLVERVIDCLSPISQGVVVVTSEEQFGRLHKAHLEAKVIIDFYPDKGPLGGIYTGLVQSDTFYNLVVACDMPFLNATLFGHLIALAPGFDIVMPMMGGIPQPMHAVYSRSCLDSIHWLLCQDKVRVLELASLVRMRYVPEDEIAKFDPQGLSFMNINTRKDLMRAETLIDRC